MTAYYLPNDEGKPTDVFLYQGDKYIDKLHRITTYNRVMAEQTEADKVAFIEQQKYVAHFDKYLRDHAIAKVGKMAVQKSSSVDEDPIELPQVQKQEEELDYIPDTDYSKMGLEAY